MQETNKSPFRYQSGFANHFATEALANTLPVGQNSPQRVAHGLYAEQLSGSAFTAPRRHNLRSWLYRIRPSVVQGEFKSLTHPHLGHDPDYQNTPNAMRWDPLPLPIQPTDFIDGLVTIVGNGNIHMGHGSAVYIYAINQSMTERFFYSSDGELLFVPEEGGLLLRTELGILDINPGEIAVIPRGIKFQVQLLNDNARGYVCENFGAPFIIPDLGPIGANGLANPRDFLTPVAFYEDSAEEVIIVNKFQGQLFTATRSHSPLDVVAWHGNYAPYKYNLRYFNTINTVSFDHPDPSIFTVLTSPTNTPGVANVDFVIFPERWLVAEHSFRPPYYHRNIMSEYMGLIYGAYDAKETGFVPGGGSLHNCMTPHGPDKEAYDKASQMALKPQHLKDTLAFMFESSMVWRPTRFAMETPIRQRDYVECWRELGGEFKG